jgi:hypothetical protein
MDVIVSVTYAPIHGPKDFVKAVETESTIGQKDRAFQPVEVFKKKVNVPLKKR